MRATFALLLLPVAAARLGALTLLIGSERVALGGAQGKAPSVIERGGFCRIDDLAAVSERDIWGVGSANLVHYDGVTRRAVDTFVPVTRWRAIDLHEGQGWAIGDECSLLHLADGSWTYSQFPKACDLTGVSVTPSGQAWAVGWELPKGAKRSLVLRFDGTRWVQAGHPFGTVNWPWSIHMISDDSGWITAGRQGFLHWDGQAWREVSYPAGVEEPVTAIDGTSEDNLWAVGGMYSGAPAFLDPVQIILHYDGAAWVAHSITSDDLLTDISVQSDREA